MGNQLGEDRANAMTKHVYALVDLNYQLSDVQGKLKHLKGSH